MGTNLFNGMGDYVDYQDHDHRGFSFCLANYTKPPFETLAASAMCLSGKYGNLLITEMLDMVRHHRII
jgi:hypothetical protein